MDAVMYIFLNKGLGMSTGKDIESYLNTRRFTTALIIDEGHTEIPAFSPTALGVELVDKDNAHVAKTFGEFSLYRDEEPKRPWLARWYR